MLQHPVGCLGITWDKSQSCYLGPAGDLLTSAHGLEHLQAPQEALSLHMGTSVQQQQRG